MLNLFFLIDRSRLANEGKESYRQSCGAERQLLQVRGLGHAHSRQNGRRTKNTGSEKKRLA